MGRSNIPYRHEVRSKLKTQVVRDKTKYNRDISKEEIRELLEEDLEEQERQKRALISMMCEAEDKGLYDEEFDIDETIHKLGMN